MGEEARTSERKARTRLPQWENLERSEFQGKAKKEKELKPPGVMLRWVRNQKVKLEGTKPLGYLFSMT